ncbi:type VII secretion protein EccC [Actinoalloteichus sp. AHMU CJ021]|uniref:DNA segregation ATPase FtsK/SpoIIIE, S-DNA-T family n=3 Tax=Actinoalloteichus cyanogriseus TaxID=2893586 RepID=A0ABT1JLS6_ACTCY|nr:type VII secretion protein EccC [Actinoalloteichus caeruleus]AUS79208.1 type VII secretion protein EccC [Actinoalloteichus sp. AHMU CJ021]MCP2333462.1 DNA segregation ATPase FtsK/SpoIIIE, S-DNA-T family [Actinoalloteichus caeruleus DSM 43889]
MSTLKFKRSPRLSAPRPPGGEVHLEPPPEVPRPIPGNIIQKLLPVIMIVASIGMMALMFTMRRNPMMLMFGGMFLISTIGMMVGGGGKGNAQKKAEMDEDRKDYLRYLGQMRDRAREAVAEQRASREWHHPDPQALWSMATSRRMWERRQNDSDFCHLRVGRGSQRLDTRLVPPQTGPVDELEPLTTLALRRFVRAHSIVPDLPIVIALRGFAAVGIEGEAKHGRALARAMISQLATFHTPEDVLIAVVTSGRAKQEWEWAKWLPHVQHPTINDGIGSLRMMAGSLGQVESFLADHLRDRQRFSRNAPPQPDQPHIVIVIDEGEVTREEYILMEEGLMGVTLLDLSNSLGKLTARRGLRLVVDEKRVGARSASGVEWFGSPDDLSLAEAEALSRKLSPYRLGAASQEQSEEEPLLSNPGVLEMAGIAGDEMTFDVQEAWRPRPVRDRYKVAFGVGEHGQLVELDIKEAAVGGMGPHGLCIGATGSGKSEFLRTLVLGLLATHSSTALNMILVDFKGGATFLGLDKAPHVAATITNLSGDLTLVDRMKDAISGEVSRRQEILAKGNFKNVWDYQKARENGADLDPLPALFICIDEFSEMLTAKPDFIDIFLQIGRVGRSLQIHMLLASQRLEEGKLRGLDTFLSYRIGLKTFSASESRAAIGVPDAYELPPVPGSGYLKFDTTSLVRFKASYVSGPYRPAGVQVGPTSAPVTADRRPKLFVPDYVEIPKEPEKPAQPAPAQKKKEEEANEPSELDVLISRLVGQGPPAHEVWLPPLRESSPLDLLMPPLAPAEDRGLSPAGFFANGRLQVPIGLVDKPFEQRRDLLWADLAGAKGHAAVVGGPQTGKSMALRTLIMSMALTHTPEEANFYCLDFGGGTLQSLSGLPHVGAVAARRDPDTVRRTIAEISGLIAQREALFGRLGVDSMADYRVRKRRGEAKEDPFGDVFLVIDGWLNFKTEFEPMEKQVQNLAGQGLSYGVHLVLTANRWAEIRPALKDLLGTRFELRLGDPTESEVDRRVAVNVPQGAPGRGLSPEKLHFLIGLPRIDGSSNSEDIANGVGDAVAKVSGAWRGPHAPKVRLLPERLPIEQMPRLEMPAGKKLVPIGVDENELAPVALDFDSDPHFMAFGERESGKTNLLRTIIEGITKVYTPREALILLVDYRRTMLGFLQTPHLLEYAVSANQLKGYVGDIKNSLAKRMPGPNVTQEELRNRSWWKGPDLFVIVDDYELVAPQGANPLQPLAEFIPQAKDVGLHVITARNIAGGSRSSFEPVIGKMKEVSTPGIIMSGPKEEANILGNIKPTAMPPGRGTVVSRRVGQQLMQIAWLEPNF